MIEPNFEQSDGKRPDVFPQRIPLKIIGLDRVLDPSAISAIIMQHLGKQESPDWGAKKKGAFASYTFWVVLPDGQAEERLRRAIHAIPGVVMQM